ncbi:MAG: hypothetical protein A2539_02585 [Elusimicrobia bacterium RIFOXYD2_FULL_34_15]|nr:MAG: hypothetical protein A2539_02585 [Elusimicrobia bacterium RIFOXYD2_FULL_34_15]
MIFHLKYGEDINEAILKKCREKNIKSGFVFFMGAIQKAELGYYNQKTKKYKKIEINKPMEIVSGIGNISLKENKIFLHAHVGLSDEKGNMHGGHLFAATVFVCEVHISKEKMKLIRKYNERTGLYLW